MILRTKFVYYNVIVKEGYADLSALKNSRMYNLDFLLQGLSFILPPGSCLREWCSSSLVVSSWFMLIVLLFGLRFVDCYVV